VVEYRSTKYTLRNTCKLTKK